MALVLAGQIVPLTEQDPNAVFAGRVWLGDDGTIDAVTKGKAKGPAGFDGSPTVDVGDALVLPGLIDLHNHLGYNTLPLWSEPAQATPFRHHNSWPNAPTYTETVTWPAWVYANAEPEALVAYVQTRALVGGTTAIQGWPGASREVNVVMRNIDSEKVGTTDPNLIYTSVATKTPLELGEMAQAIGHDVGFIYHCAEGQPGSVVESEFVDAADAGCLRRTFIAIHCNALAPADWTRWAKNQPGAVVWSPFSNLWLYGVTADITAARARDVSICLGSDWGPSGTKHVLGEMKVAKIVSGTNHLGLSDKDVVAMVTTNPGDVLARCWSRPIGRLVSGGFADVTVLRAGGAGDVWSQIVAATERDVKLVVVGGRPRYGDAAVMTAAGVKASSALTIAGTRRKLVLPRPDDPTKAWSWTDIHRRLEAVRKDPKAALANARKRRGGFAGALDDEEAPLELVLDMPGGGPLAFAGPPPDPAAVKIAPLPTLVHDPAFFKAIHGHGFHSGVLDGLEAFY